MFTITDIADATGGRIIGNSENEVSGVSTDSRSVTAGELFVPLRGASFDGHDYLASVAGQGVQTVLAAESWLADHTLPESLDCIAVQDTLRALGDLAAVDDRADELVEVRVRVIGAFGRGGEPEEEARVKQSIRERFPEADLERGPER